MEPHTHCLWVDPDIAIPFMDEIANIPAEKVPFGGYIPSVTGTENTIRRLYERIQAKPYLVEKLIKKMA